MIKRLTTLALVSTLGMAAAGCYGKYALTKKVYDWNGSVTGNKFANSAIHWVLLIVPVYAVTFLIDFLILNTIEVFSGSNPIGSVRVREHGGHRYALRKIAVDRVQVEKDGAIMGVIERRADGTLVAVDASHGELVLAGR